MKIAMIAAMAHERVIGADNDMPWHLPADLKHFKQITLGKPVVMGRKTYASIGKALPGRPNIVISSSTSLQLADADVVSSCDDAIEKAATYLTSDDDEIMIIGGGTLYEAFLARAQTLYLTEIDLAVDGDTYFPDYHARGEWACTFEERHDADEKNPHRYRFLTFKKKE
tara:strand:- start:5 stop:511 length:507 start_codon:yes stop_codon:yes gene_type:complete